MYLKQMPFKRCWSRFALETLDEGIAAYKTGKEVLGEVAGNMMELGLKGL